jgi:DNA-binding MarR family transcriptional regulator
MWSRPNRSKSRPCEKVLAPATCQPGKDASQTGLWFPWQNPSYGLLSFEPGIGVGDLLGVNVTDMQCLALTFFKGLATPTEPSHITGLTAGATTAMLDRLEKARLIERCPNPQDRRGTLIVLMNERTEEVGGQFASGREAIDNLNSSYSEKELELAVDYFKSWSIFGSSSAKNLY